MNKIKIATTILSLSFATNAMAIEVLKTHCPKQTLASNIEQVYVLDKGVSCDVADSYIETIKNLESLSPKSIQKINIALALSGNDASNKVEHIEIPSLIYIYDLDGRFSLPQKIKNNYLAHEYGHSVFNKIVESKYPALKKSLARLEGLNHIQYDLYQARIKGNGEEISKLEKKLEDAELDFYSSDVAMAPIFEILPASELFSDLVSVVFAEDLKAFSKTFLGPRPSNQDLTDASFRDFSFDHKLEGWANDQRHEYYAPVRSFIGKRLKFPMNKSDKKALLFSIGDKIADHLNATRGKNLSPYENNRLLIDRLKLTLF